MVNKKGFNYIVLCLLLLTVLLSSSGCGGGGGSSSHVDNNIIKFTVTFDSCGGSEVEPQIVTSGDILEKPEPPTREGYIFADWYKDNTYNEIFMFGENGDKIIQDITLYAKWTENSSTPEAPDTPTPTPTPSPEPTPAIFTVTFNTNGGSAVISLTVEANKTIEQPNDPIREGYVFAGWYKKAEFNELFHFGSDGDKIKNNITLYARWFDADLLIAQYAAGEIVIGYQNGDNAKHVTENLTLPTIINRFLDKQNLLLERRFI